jgi:hypothetical protein
MAFLFPQVIAQTKEMVKGDGPAGRFEGRDAMKLKR